MIRFRRLTFDDLDMIYKDDFLRPLITVSPLGEKFAIIIEKEDGSILGGASGYTDGNSGVIQSIVIKDTKDNILKDGLIRAIIHILELDGYEYLFTMDKDTQMLRKLGFQYFDKSIDESLNLSSIIRSDIKGKEPFIINLKEFFLKDKLCSVD